MRSLASPKVDKVSPVSPMTPSTSSSTTVATSVTLPYGTQSPLTLTVLPTNSLTNTNSESILNASSQSLHEELLVENRKLKDEVSHLKEQVRTILDHSIESDTRLLEYTNEVFIANTPRTGTVDIAEFCSTSASITTADRAVQCDPPGACQSDVCAQDRALITSLRTTIEVLEAEIESLKVVMRDCSCKEASHTSPEWKACYNKKIPPVLTQNKFAILSIEEDSILSSRPTKQQIKNYSTKHRSNQNMYNNKFSKSKKTHKQYKESSKMDHLNTFPPTFRYIDIEADSHGRHLSGLLQELLPEGTRVSSVVKPGAKLLDVVSNTSPAPGSCTVIVAGTNDLASGEQNNIYKHLEERLVAKLKHSKVVVATLPTRHDLPTHHPVNRQTKLVNGHIMNLSAKHDGVEVVDFNNISRHLFTGHGMHLRLPGKRSLAKMIARSLVRFGALQDAARLPSPDDPLSDEETRSPARSPSLPAAEPPSMIGSPHSAGSLPRDVPVDGVSHHELICLPYETYSEAVKKSPLTKDSNVTLESRALAVPFLEVVVETPVPQCQ